MGFVASLNALLSTVDEIRASCGPVITAREEATSGIAGTNAEYACALILSQLASISSGMELLYKADALANEHGAVASLLARSLGEGLAYTSFLLSGDKEWNAAWFFCSGIAWRESFNDRLDGKPWRRSHGKLDSRPGSRVARAHTAKLRVSAFDTQGLDEFEVAWVVRALGVLQPQAGELLRGHPNMAADVLQWRSYWRELGSQLQGQARDTWRSSVRLWNEMQRWPFGLTPLQAAERGRMWDVLDELEPEEGDHPPEDWRAGMKEGVRVLAFDLFPNWAHLSPARVTEASRDFDMTTVMVSAFLLRTTVLLVSRHYKWARRVVENQWHPSADDRATA